MNHSVFLFRSAGGNACTYSFAIGGLPKNPPLRLPSTPREAFRPCRRENTGGAASLCGCVRRFAAVAGFIGAGSIGGGRMRRAGRGGGGDAARSKMGAKN